MSIFTHFLYTLVFLACFTLAYFSLEKLTSTKKFINIGLPVEAINLMFGLTTGLIALLAEYLVDYYGKNDFVFHLLISATLIAYFKNWQSSLFSIVPSLIYTLVTQDLNKMIIYQLISIFIFIFTIELSNFLVPENKRWASLTSVLFIFAIFSLPFVYLYFDKNTIMQRIEGTTFTYLWTIIVFAMFYYLIRFTISSKILFQSSNFSFLNYYRPGLANKNILSSIASKKIDEALMVIFEINYENKLLTKEQKDELTKTILEIISKKVSKEATLFFATDGKYGVFTPIFSYNDDLKTLLENSILRIPEKFRTSWGDIENATIKAGVSAYGINDSSLEKLIQYSTYALNTTPTTEKVNIFNSEEYLKTIRDTEELTEMDKNISLDDYKNSFTELWSLDDLSPFAVRVKTENVSEFSWIESIDERIYFKNWNKIFTRYFANNALKTVKNVPLVIDYDISIFEDKFKINDFLHRLKDLEIDAEKIYFVIKNISLPKVRSTKIVAKNIGKLQECGIKFIVESNCEPTLIKKLLNKVNYVILNSSEINNFPDAILIKDDVSSESEITSAISNEIKIIGGPLIKNKFTFKKFDKQSKIYIEEIIALKEKNDK